MNVWAPLFSDQSSYLRGSGDTIHSGEITSRPTIRDYSRNADLAAAERVVTSDDTLTLTQEKYWHFGLDDVDNVQTRPELIDGMAQNAAEEMAKVMNDYLRGVFDAAVPAGNQLTTEDQVTEAGFASQLIGKFFDASEMMDTQSVPMDQRWVVVHPKVKSLLLREMYGEAVESRRRESAIMNAELERLVGFRIIVDPGIAVAAANRYRVNIGRSGGLFNVAAYQVRKVEGFRSPSRFEDVVRGLYVYGASVWHAEHNFRIQPATS